MKELLKSLCSAKRINLLRTRSGSDVHQELIQIDIANICKHIYRSIVPPMLSIPNQLEAAYQGQDVILECQTEAYPASINYWTTDKGDMIISG